MKKSILTFLSFCLLINWSFAQILEEERSMSAGAQNSLTIELKNAQKKDVEKLWAKYMKKFKGKTKKDRKLNETFSDDATIEAMSMNTVDVYAKVSQGTDGSDITAWFDLGGAFLNSAEHAREYAEAEKMLLQFALNVAIFTTEEELDNEEDQLKKREKELKKLVSKKEQLLADIESFKAKIAQAEKDIEINESNQAEKQNEIKAQQDVVDEVRQKLSDLEN